MSHFDIDDIVPPRPPRPPFNPIPLIVFLVVLGGVAWVVLRADQHASTEAPPAPTGPRLSHCFVDGLVLGGAPSLRITLDDGAFAPFPLDGKLVLSVEHAVPNVPAPSQPPYGDSAVVCQLTAVVTASGYDGGVVVSGTFDKACPAAAPADRVVLLNGSFTSKDGGSPTYCEYGDAVPAALGGHDLTTAQQVTAFFRASAERDKPAEFAVVHGYLASLARSVVGIDPSLSPKVTECPTQVRGKAMVLSFGTLESIVAPMRPPDAGAAAVHSDLTYDSPTAKLLLPGWETPEKVATLSTKLDALGHYAVVLTTLSVVEPMVQIPERTGAVTEARMTPGSYRGGLFVVDREAAKVVCAAPVVATNRDQKFESTNPNDLRRSVRDDLSAAIYVDFKAKLAKIAPQLEPSNE